MTITEQFDKHNLNYDTNYQTSRMSSMKCGGAANLVVYPKTTNELILAIKIAAEYCERYKIIGGCTNTFFADEGYDGALISTRLLSSVTIHNSKINIQAGAPLVSVLRYSAEQGIDLGAGLYGIPGTIGGAVRNNAGAFSSETSSVFSRGSFYDIRADKILTLDKDDLTFGYRSSILQRESLVFICGVFEGKSRDTRAILKDFNAVLKRRCEMHPKESSLGSFFKRNEGVIPARLIDELGLKGMRVGFAEVSKKHAGFIVNVGGATSRDVDDLATKIERTVYDAYRVTLVREAELVK